MWSEKSQSSNSNFVLAVVSQMTGELLKPLGWLLTCFQDQTCLPAFEYIIWTSVSCVCCYMYSIL